MNKKQHSLKLELKIVSTTGNKASDAGTTLPS